MIYMPMPELETSIEMLGPQERGLALTVLADQCVSKDATWLPNYWKREEYADWLRLYGRTLLRKWYADNDDPKTHFMIPKDDEGITIWDYFHQPQRVLPADPWFVRNRHYNLNHRGLLLRKNWNQYSRLFNDIKLPSVGFQQLVPGVHRDTWIVDNIIQTEVPINCVPPEWREPKI